MPAYTIVTTSAAQGAEAAEISTISDDFANESEAGGYSRRMADEMLSFAGQLALDFDYSNVALYEGDHLEAEIDPSHAAFLGLWVLDEEGAAYVTAEEFRQEAAGEA